MAIRTTFLQFRFGGSPRGLVALAFGLLLVGCSAGTRLTTEAAGHVITAEVAGPHSIKSDAGRAVVTGQYGQVTVERARAQIDSQPWTPIPPDVAVRISILRGRLQLSAGPVSIRRTISNQ